MEAEAAFVTQAVHSSFTTGQADALPFTGNGEQSIKKARRWNRQALKYFKLYLRN